MTYEKKLAEAKRLYQNANADQRYILESLFPELQEDNDEGVRKAIIRILKGETRYISKEDTDKYVAWLEKQGEQKQTWKPTAAQLIVIKDLIEDKNTSKVNKVILRGMFDEFKQFTNSHKREIDDAYLQGICDAKNEIEKQSEQPTDKVEPKFHPGDWIIGDEGIFKISQYDDDGGYNITDTTGCVVHFVSPNHVESNYRLWSINDAKDGDVLAAHECLVLFKQIDGLNIDCYCTYHYMGFNPSFHVNTLQNKEAFHPATKEQRDLLFAKIIGAGYEWNAEKKELMKIELNFDEAIALLGDSIIDHEDIVKISKEDFGL